MSDDGLESLRERIRAVDRQILQLAAERTRLARDIGQSKVEHNLPIQDFQVERLVVERARAVCEELGLDADLGEAVMRPLIAAALKVQEKDRTGRRRHQGSGLRVLILGGAGLMGRWFARFLDDQGHVVTILDPDGPVEGFASINELDDGLAACDVVLLATTPSVTSGLLDDIRRIGTDAIVMDICSLKSPVKGQLEALADQGFSVCSIHPMFGPSADLLSGRHVVFCPLGDEKALQTARGFFEHTCAGLVEMSLDDHDRLVAYVLGLSHAINILFNDVLSRTRPLTDLRTIGSTTFERQVQVAEQVASESPDLYYEIQAMNAYTPQILDSLRDSLDRFDRYVRDKHRKGFIGMMEHAHDYYAAYRAQPDEAQDTATTTTPQEAHQ